MSWKEKRIIAMNRIIKNTGCSTLDYLDEYTSILSSKAKNKMEYKLERKNEENNVPISPRRLPD